MTQQNVREVYRKAVTALQWRTWSTVWDEPRPPRFQWLRDLFKSKPKVLEAPEFDFTKYKPESWK